MPAMNKTSSCTVGFCDQFVHIQSYGVEAEKIVNFLCCDLQQDSKAPSIAKYDVMSVGSKPIFSLWYEGNKIYDGESKYDLAYALINEIIHHCIVNNNKGHVIHAAAITSGKGGILLPGESGSGKSTFTTWLVSKGYGYLTDELVVITEKTHRIVPFTRPLSIKKGSVSVVSSFVNPDPQHMITGRNGSMLAHRCVNSNFEVDTPPLTLILFPKYQPNSPLELKRISPAIACAKLMECYVNARNIPGHGIGTLADLIRNTQVYQLTYGTFDGIQKLLGDTFEEFSCLP